MTASVDVAKLPRWSDSDIRQLRKIATARSFRAGAVIAREGTPAKECRLLLSGEVAVAKEVDGQTRIVGMLRAGALIGQLTLVGADQHEATLQAHTDVDLLALTATDYAAILESGSDFAARFQRSIAIGGIRQLRQATIAAAELMARAPRETRPRSRLGRRLEETQALRSDAAGRAVGAQCRAVGVDHR